MDNDFKLSNLVKNYKNNSIIFSEGSKGREMFVILKGEVDITQMVQGEPQLLTTLAPGMFFGEMSTIRAVPRVATAQAKGDVDCLVVSPDVFKSMLQKKPGFGIKVIKELCNRLEFANKKIEKLALINQTERVIVILTNMATNYGAHPLKPMKFLYENVVNEIASKTSTDKSTVEKAIVTLSRYGKLEVLDDNKTKYIQVSESLLKHGN